MIILQILGADQFLAGCVFTLHTTGEHCCPEFPLLFKMHWLCATTNRGWLAAAGWDNTADSWLQVWPHLSNRMPVAASLFKFDWTLHWLQEKAKAGFHSLLREVLVAAALADLQQPTDLRHPAQGPMGVQLAQTALAQLRAKWLSHPPMQQAMQLLEDVLVTVMLHVCPRALAARCNCCCASRPFVGSLHGHDKAQ